MNKRLRPLAMFSAGALLVAAALFLVPASGLPAAAQEDAIRAIQVLDQALSPEQQQAQVLALGAAQVIDQVDGARTEVFGIYPMGDSYPRVFASCASGACYQVDFYDYDHNTALAAIVDLAQEQVLDVLVSPNTHPLINRRLHDLAVELIRNHPDVVTSLGFRPEPADIRLMEGNRMDTSCDGRHICAGAVFPLDSGNLWVLVDLTEERVARFWWADRLPGLEEATGDSEQPEVSPDDCGATIHLDRDGWQMDYTTMPTDALHLFDVTFQVDGVDRPVATSMKLLEWHAHYPGDWGFVDYTGCGGGGGGFPIPPYPRPPNDPTQVLDLLGPGGTYLGFEVVQDFRMSSWGNYCNYRYEQHFQFFTDGRWRVVTVAYGRGCGNGTNQEATYRPVVRIDIAANGDDGDSLALWDGNDWVTQSSENWWLQNGPYTAEGYRYRVTDQGGTGYYVEPGQGQFGDGGTGDNAYLYATLYRTGEGDIDMGSIGACCTGDHQQGPHNYVNGEGIDGQNLVLWYVPQSEAITTWQVNQGLAPVQYCWTENQSTYWPCASGPMFVPIADACSPFDVDCNETIDATDVASVASYWNCRESDDGCYDRKYDVNGNGVTDIWDVMSVAGRWGCSLGDACYY